MRSRKCILTVMRPNEREFLISKERAEAILVQSTITVQDILQKAQENHALTDEQLRFLYKGIIIKHNKTEPTYTKTSLFLCEKRRFFMARTEKGVVATI